MQRHGLWLPYQLQVLTAWRPAATLSDEELEEIWAFASNFFDRPRDSFVALLRSCDDLCVLRDNAGCLRGIAGLRYSLVERDGESHLIIYTPTALLDRTLRGKNLIQLAALSRVTRQRQLHPRATLYWMYTAGTYISYMLLRRNFVHYWPIEGQQMPEFAAEIIDDVVNELGYAAWDRATGVVCRTSECRYREGNVDDAEESDNPDIRAYARLNPGQHNGDTLICLCPLTGQNWAYMVRKAVHRAVRRMWPSTHA